MDKENLSEFTDDQLIIEKRKLKKSKVINATLIGFLAGILFIGVAALIYKRSAVGIIPMLIPVFLIYQLVKNSKKDKELEGLLKERKLN
jgi:hypothetical protein